MDFHSLSRRDLQALCKKNKIPANMTNVAMADALQALETVEGLEEILAHPEADSLKTPAKSMAATPSVCRASNRQRTVKEEPEEISKMTRTRRGATTGQGIKDMPDTAAPSTRLHAYSTRRSTRLLEKQIGQLSLKEDDEKADLEKDSQDMQRQFSEDMENSLASDNQTFSDDTTEATEQPQMVEDPVEQAMKLKNDSVDHENVSDGVEESNLVQMDVVLENEKPLPVVEPDMKLNNEASDLENASSEVEEFINEKDDDEDQPMQEDSAVLTDTISHPEETQHIVNVVSGDMLVSSGIKSKATENAADEGQQPMQEDVVEQQNKFPEVSSYELETQHNVTGTEETGSLVDNPTAVLVTEDGGDAKAEQKDSEQMEASDAFDEFDFLSESDMESDDQEEEVEQPAAVDAPQPPMDGDNVAESFGSIQCISESEKEYNATAGHNSDNKEEVQIGARLPLGLKTLQDENNAAPAAGTPIEKKSLRQLKKMIKQGYKQAEVKRPTPLQVRPENVQ